MRAFLWQFFNAATIERLSETPFAGLDLEQLGRAAARRGVHFLAGFEALPNEPEATEEPAAKPPGSD